MSSYLRQATSALQFRAAPPPFLLALLILAAALLLAMSASGVAMPGGAAESGRLHADLARMAKLVNRELKPPAQRLARSLPGDAERLQALREPASTTQAQVAIALSELRQMGAIAILDPHYLPALVAAGRAHVSVSGQDPLTQTTINPGYRGLEPELAGSAARLEASAAEAAKLSARVKRLQRLVAALRRR
jgi:hypothetical protein